MAQKNYLNVFQCFENPTLALISMLLKWWSLITITNSHHYWIAGIIPLALKGQFHSVKENKLLFPLFILPQPL